MDINLVPATMDPRPQHALWRQHGARASFEETTISHLGYILVFQRQGDLVVGQPV